MINIGKGYIYNGKVISIDEFDEKDSKNEIENFDPRNFVGLTAKERKVRVQLHESSQKAEEERKNKAVSAKEKAAADEAAREVEEKRLQDAFNAAMEAVSETKKSYEEAIPLEKINPSVSGIINSRKELHLKALKAAFDAEAKLKAFKNPAMSDFYKEKSESDFLMATLSFKSTNPDPISVNAPAATQNSKYSIEKGTDANGEFDAILVDKTVLDDQGNPKPVLETEARRDIARGKSKKEDFEWRKVIRIFKGKVKYGDFVDAFE